MKELDEAIQQFRNAYECEPSVIYLGRLQLSMLRSSFVPYKQEYRGIRIIIVQEDDHLHVTEAP